MRLYEISSDYRDIIAAIEGGEIPEDQALDLIAHMEGEWTRKAEAVCAYMLNLRAEAAMVREAERRMAERRQSLERKAERLADYLQQQMIALGKTEIKTAQWRARIRKNPASVVIDDEDIIPADYVQVFTRVDKAAVKAALAENQDVPGAHLEQKLRLDVK